ncbi:MAG: hypothetical protein HY066_09675 [Betaproteobacteria bacterium]|nr:hypothetical protein [Betaproteobacteria bacterium]
MIKTITLLAALLATSPGQAQAADPAHTSATQPGKTMADTPVVVYQSVLDGYHPFRDEKVSSWQASNDNVARIGGWRVYAREAREPEPAPATAASGEANSHAGQDK